MKKDSSQQPALLPTLQQQKKQCGGVTTQLVPGTQTQVQTTHGVFLALPGTPQSDDECVVE